MDMEKEALGRFVFRGERSEDGPTETRRSAEEVENVRRAGSFSFVVSKKKNLGVNERGLFPAISFVAGSYEGRGEEVEPSPRRRRLQIPL